MTRSLRRSLPLLALAALAACGDDDGGALPGADGGFVACVDDGDCSDGLYCNGVETCSPSAPGANPRGCVVGDPPCPLACDEVEDTCLTSCPDADEDGARDAACGGTDCDDANAAVYPGAPEVCDEAGVDEDCDPTTVGDRDADGDGFAPTSCCNGELCGTDCDDDETAVQPGQVEVCNDVDDDCDGMVDEGVRAEAWPDADRDGWGDVDGTPESVCVVPSGAATRGGDCDDANPFHNPGAVDGCDGADDDCDGRFDESGDAACAVALGSSAAGGFCYGAGTAGASCRYGECLPGLSDCNGDPSDGCEVDVCRATRSCDFCGRACGAACEDGVCTADMIAPPGFAFALIDPDGPIVGVGVREHETCRSRSTVTDEMGVGTLGGDTGPVGPDLLVERDGYLPTLTHRAIVFFTRAELDAWLTAPEVDLSWDERTGIVVIRHDASVWGAPVRLYPELLIEPDPPVEQPSSPPFFVAEDGSVTPGRGGSPGSIVFVNVPAGRVRMEYDSPMCTINGCAGSRSFRVRAGTISYVPIGGCGGVTCS
ncbi:MAG TPA: putative metal-binding motif-containing protein [Polyangiaceae bacterium LLY-WYZ-15_(1-7)]|nr:hypothetical protein [Sandaracinus sp.]HJL02261.1 putative metal-binding motif-containing protein [Polyangiaceae bacterium LLY-WYZ-15_(1-7)]HJL09291.1 putative metal-binding motif-containing protein [Polyangiaceae bacterium LLY-WYZ-15_(1-7)]HJL24539.1 putative metal-binding motif-containing protein [Polyangiaceae bacterium LLY-WYZ-15_(1-7)]HJL34647.1 putative metal-binding motif-containing protein [Polyangiaceae bacterium LLY-WYZ-15_(1-7)]